MTNRRCSGVSQRLISSISL